jgi:GNAT superfamily N-acetyltransferase
MGLAEEDLPQVILESLFLLPRMTGDGDPLPISGVRGWISGRPTPYLNRVGLKNKVDADSKIAEVIEFFRANGKGFTLVLGPGEINAGLGAKLLSKGLRPARFCSLGGMYCTIQHRRACDSIILKPVELDRIENVTDIIARSYGIDPRDVEGIWGAKVLPPALDWQLYVACLNDAAQTPVGFGASALVENGRILLLRGSGVLPEYRKRGIYRELALQRMALALEQGVEQAIVQSARSSSHAVLKSIGFKEVCSIELYEWSPACCSVSC